MVGVDRAGYPLRDPDQRPLFDLGQDAAVFADVTGVTRRAHRSSFGGFYRLLVGNAQSRQKMAQACRRRSRGLKAADEECRVFGNAENAEDPPEAAPGRGSGSATETTTYKDLR